MVKLRGLVAILSVTVPLFRPLDPIFSEELDRMRRANRPVSAGEAVGGAEFVTPPADALGMGRMKGRDFHFHGSSSVAPAGPTFYDAGHIDAGWRVKCSENGRVS